MSRVLRKRANKDSESPATNAKAKAAIAKPAVASKKRVVKAQTKTAESADKVTGKNSIAVMLAENYDADRDDPSGWLMSEKMDGVRCYWNGTTMFTRNGNKFFPPQSWIDQLPPIALDGELWSGRDNFFKIVKIVRKQVPNEEDWSTIKYMVYDAPLVKGTFEERLDAIRKELALKKNKLVTLVNQTVCKSKDHLLTLMDEICGGKGEGVMLKNPKCDYDRFRSINLLKVKRFEDAEATVYDYQDGAGRCTGMMGALMMVEKDGTKFKIGSGFSDSQRQYPPAIGAVVTFKFQGRTQNGIPRFPIFMREHPGM